MVIQQLFVILVFSQEKMSAHPYTLPSWTCLPVFSFWNPYNASDGVFNFVTEDSGYLRFVFHSFFFFILFYTSVSAFLSSRSLICSSASVILLLIPSSVLFISVYLVFYFSRSLVSISCIFSILFQRSWTICTIISSLGVYRLYDRVFILFSLWWRRIRGCLRKRPDGRDWLRGKLDLVLMGRAMLSKSLIQFSVYGWSCFLPAIYLRPNYGGGNEDNDDLP